MRSLGKGLAHSRQVKGSWCCYLKPIIHLNLIRVPRACVLPETPAPPLSVGWAGWPPTPAGFGPAPACLSLPVSLWLTVSESLS